MAAKSAIGMMRNDALERIEAALPGFEMPRQGNDAMLLHAKQLQAIAEFLECQQEKSYKWVVPNGTPISATATTVLVPSDATYERLEAFAAAVNVEDAPINEPAYHVPTKPAPKAKRK